MNNKYAKFNKNQMKKYIDQIIFLDGEVVKQIRIGGIYISSHGRVFSTNYKHKKDLVKQLKTTIDKDGYELIIINYDGKHYGYHIHRLVALHYIKNNDKRKTQVNHKDCIKTHNIYSNLEWTTPKENIEHAWRNNLSQSKGTKNGNNKYSDDMIEKACLLLENNVPMNDIRDKTGVSYAMISLILRKRNWIHISSKYDIDNYKRRR